MVWDFVRQQRGRLWLEFLPAYAPERTRSSTCGRTGSTMNCRTSVPTATENLVTTLAKHYGGCATGPCWSARFGSRQTCFLCILNSSVRKFHRKGAARDRSGLQPLQLRERDL